MRSRRGITSFAGLMPNGLYGERASTAFLRAVEARAARSSSLQTYRARRVAGGGAARLQPRRRIGAVLVADGGAARRRRRGRASAAA